ncbi:MAG: hypothetical protein HQK57_06725 [Deltaproteobacteria bacterium]|nr:hypothetical protein [Deltaproteobacteria bacterium]MBF0495225.1 hypothetical protein [Deltaproteobacteria bacterium]MBF0508605.1 hypothetical protein [Deltaproteobacteria bacterium]
MKQFPPENRVLAVYEVQGRLNCFGEFDNEDEICLQRCGLNINCALAKRRSEDIQLMDDSIFPYPCSEFE